MRRRDFVAGMLALAAAGPSLADPTRARVGYLSGGSTASGRDFTINIFREQLRELGWSGDKLNVEERWANGDFSALPHLAADLVALRPDVIVSTGSSETKALQALTADIPILFTQVADPVGSGLVTTIARPGGNLTGLAQG